MDLDDKLKGRSFEFHNIYLHTQSTDNLMNGIRLD